MTEGSGLRGAVVSAIDNSFPILDRVCTDLHAHVEYAFEEYKSSSLIASLLADAGFEVSAPLCGLDTAFRADRSSGNGPTIAFLCEYDGLYPYGQSCGHNVAAAASVGAALGLASVLANIDGTVRVIGTPAEEAGGKYLLYDLGAFAGTDAMMLIYPGMDNIADSRSLVAVSFTVEYFGRAAHGAAHPELGVNALDAVVHAYSAVALLRQQLPADVRIHGVVDRGGDDPRVIPDYTRARFIVRANTGRDVDRVLSRVLGCLDSAAVATGCEVRTTIEDRRAHELVSNPTMAALCAKNLTSLGRTVRGRDELAGAWSCDTGYVSQFIPTIQPQIAMTTRDVSPHSYEFHLASNSETARQCFVDGAKAMALTALDLLMQPDLLDKCRTELPHHIEH
jgi:amidohydrolase